MKAKRGWYNVPNNSENKIFNKINDTYLKEKRIRN